MVNQQLIDYIKTQLQVGVGKDEIKSALLESGWQSADVNEAMQKAGGAPAVPGGAASSMTQVPVKTSESKLASGAGGAVVKTSDIFQPKNEPMFDPKAAAGSAAKAQPTSVPGKSAGPVMVGAAASVSSGRRKLGGLIVMIVLTVAFIASAGSAVYLYTQKADLEVQLAPLETTRMEADALKKQMTVLQQERDGLAAQVTQLQNANTALLADLAIFKVPDGTAPGATENITVTGTLRQDGSQYSALTANGTAVVIKNSKDTKVSGVLQPLVGTSATLSGTHIIGSREMTVTTVNGAAIQ